MIAYIIWKKMSKEKIINKEDIEKIKKFYSKPYWVIMTILSILFYYWIVMEFIELYIK